MPKDWVVQPSPNKRTPALCFRPATVASFWDSVWGVVGMRPLTRQWGKLGLLELPSQRSPGCVCECAALCLRAPHSWAQAHMTVS